MVDELKIYETEFKPLFENGEYYKATDILLKNQGIAKYLSKEEDTKIAEIVDEITSTFNEAFSQSMDGLKTIQRDIKNAKHTMFENKFGVGKLN